MRARNWIAQHAPVWDMAREVLAGPDEHLRLDMVGGEIVGVLPGLHRAFAHPTEELVRLHAGGRFLPLLSKFIAEKVLRLDDMRLTPAETHTMMG